jgi:exodeoxyribonuclease VII small subunit
MAKKPLQNDSNATPGTTPSSEAGEPSFEESLNNLEGVVEQLEGGELSLEASLRLYEQGIGLSDHCQKALDAAEHKVRILSERKDGDVLEEHASRDGADHNG